MTTFIPRTELTAAQLNDAFSSVAFNSQIQTLVTLSQSTGAAAVGFAPAGGIAATTVQAAVVELDSEKASKVDIQSGGLVTIAAALTGTEYAATPSPAITAYTAGQRFQVTFDTASPAAPTLKLNGIATPPNLVHQNSDGTFSNLGAGDFPAGWVSSVKIISATQALVELMPYASINGSSSKVFSVSSPTSANHAVPANWVGYMPTVSPAASPDIFGAAGATVNYSGAAVTMTSIAACSAAQVGSTKRIVPAADANITASANLIVDGATSGTIILPASSIIEVLATSTTTFKVSTVEAYGTWVPNQGAGLTLVGAFTSSGTYKVSGGIRVVTGVLNGATSVAVSAGGVLCTNLPFVVGSTSQIGSSINGSTTAGGIVSAASGGNTVYSATALSASTRITFTVTY